MFPIHLNANDLKYLVSLVVHRWSNTFNAIKIQLYEIPCIFHSTDWISLVGLL